MIAIHWTRSITETWIRDCRSIFQEIITRMMILLRNRTCSGDHIVITSILIGSIIMFIRQHLMNCRKNRRNTAKSSLPKQAAPDLHIKLIPSIITTVITPCRHLSIKSCAKSGYVKSASICSTVSSNSLFFDVVFAITAQCKNSILFSFISFVIEIIINSK